MQDLKNLYSITNETMSASDSSTYIDAGIHENVELTEIKKGKAKNGSDFVAIYFENEKGDKVSYTEFPLKFNKELNEMSPDELSNALKRVGYQMSRWKQIIQVFKPGETLVASSFVEFIDKIISTIGNSYKGKKLRVKVVYDNRNFTTLDNNPNVTFIESMEIPTSLSKIRILPTDKMKREKPDVEKQEVNSVENLLEESEAPNKKNEDNLPF